MEEKEVEKKERVERNRAVKWHATHFHFFVLPEGDDKLMQIV